MADLRVCARLVTFLCLLPNSTRKKTTKRGRERGTEEERKQESKLAFASHV